MHIKNMFFHMMETNAIQTKAKELIPVQDLESMIKDIIFYQTLAKHDNNCSQATASSNNSSAYLTQNFFNSYLSLLPINICITYVNLREVHLSKPLQYIMATLLISNLCRWAMAQGLFHTQKIKILNSVTQDEI